MIELLIGNRTTGQIWDVANSVTAVSWQTERTGQPGRLNFTLIKAGDISFFEGDIVRFSVDGSVQFIGWVFTKTKDRWGIIEVVCYDRLRYLKPSASYAFYGETATSIIRQIAQDMRLEIGELTETTYVIPSLIESDQPCINIIQEAIQQELLNTGRLYVFYDNGDGLSLKEAAQMQSDVLIGEKSLLGNYSYKTDIDEHTANTVRLYFNDTGSGSSKYVQVQDSYNQERWGVLLLSQSIDNVTNTAQAVEKAKTMMQYYNRRFKTLKVDSLGVRGLRAGNMVRLLIPGLGDVDLDEWALITKITHTWENDLHTMSFEILFGLEEE